MLTSLTIQCNDRLGDGSMENIEIAEDVIFVSGVWLWSAC